MKINNRNNGLNPLYYNNQNKIMCMKIKQVYAKLEKDLISIFDCFKVDFRDKQLNDSKKIGN